MSSEGAPLVDSACSNISTQLALRKLSSCTPGNHTHILHLNQSYTYRLTWTEERFHSCLTHYPSLSTH